MTIDPREFILNRPTQYYLRVDLSRAYPGANRQHYFLWFDEEGHTRGEPIPLSLEQATALKERMLAYYPPPKYLLEIVEEAREALEPRDFILKQRPTWYVLAVTRRNDEVTLYLVSGGLNPFSLDPNTRRAKRFSPSHAQELLMALRGATTSSWFGQRYKDARLIPTDIEAYQNEAVEPRDFIINQVEPRYLISANDPDGLRSFWCERLGVGTWLKFQQGPYVTIKIPGPACLLSYDEAVAKLPQLKQCWGTYTNIEIVPIVPSVGESVDPREFIVSQPTYVVARIVWKPEFAAVLASNNEGHWLNTATGIELTPQRMVLTDAMVAKEHWLKEWSHAADVVIEPAENQGQMYWQGRRWPQDFNESALEEALEDFDVRDYLVHVKVPWVARMRWNDHPEDSWQYATDTGFHYPGEKWRINHYDTEEEAWLGIRHFMGYDPRLEKRSNQTFEAVPISAIQQESAPDPRDFILQQKPPIYVVKATYRDGRSPTPIYLKYAATALLGMDWTGNMGEAQRLVADKAQEMLARLNRLQKVGHFESVNEFSLVRLQQESGATQAQQSIQESKSVLIGSVVAICKSKVALVKGKKDRWSLPAGRAKDDESVFHAAARECREECGLPIKPAELIFVGVMQRSKHKTDSIFVVELKKTQALKAGTDAKEAMWFSLDELPKLDHDHGVAIKKALRVLKMKPKERGQLIAFEGVDGSGKSTQVELTVEWLKKHGYPVIETKWNSSPVISPAIKKAKKTRELSPVLYHLLHSADLLHRYEQMVVPALGRNFIVVCDRYWPTGIVRDRLRGVDNKSLYAKLRKPDVLFYFSTTPEVALKRLVKAGRLSWYGIGMDLNYADDEQDNALEYTRRMKRLYSRNLPCGHVALNANRKVENIFKDVKAKLERCLNRHYFQGVNLHERAQGIVAGLLETDVRDFIQQNEPVWYRVALRMRDGTRLYTHSAGFTNEVKYALGYKADSALEVANGIKAALKNEPDWFGHVEVDPTNVTEVFIDPVVEDRPAGGVDFYEAQDPRDFILKQKLPRYYIVCTSASTGHKLLWCGMRHSTPCGPWVEEQFADIALRIKAQDVEKMLARVKQEWGEHDPLIGGNYVDFRAEEVAPIKESVDPRDYILSTPLVKIVRQSVGHRDLFAEVDAALDMTAIRWTRNWEEATPIPADIAKAWLAQARFERFNRECPSFKLVPVNEAVEPRDFILGSSPRYRLVATGIPEGRPLYLGRYGGWRVDPKEAYLLTAKAAQHKIEEFEALARRYSYTIKDFRTEIAEAMDPRDFILKQRAVIYNIVGTNIATGNRMFFTFDMSWSLLPTMAWRGGATSADRWVEIVKGSHEGKYKDIHAEIETRVEEAMDPRDYILGGKNHWELRIRDDEEAERTREQDDLRWPQKPGEYRVIDFYCNGEHVGLHDADEKSGRLAPVDQRLLDYWKRQIEALDSWDQFHPQDWPNHGIWEWLMKHNLMLDRPAQTTADKVYAEGPERLKQLGWLGEAQDPRDFILAQPTPPFIKVVFIRSQADDLEHAQRHFPNEPKDVALRKQFQLEIDQQPALKGTYDVLSIRVTDNDEYRILVRFNTGMSQPQLYGCLQKTYDEYGMAGSWVFNPAVDEAQDPRDFILRQNPRYVIASTSTTKPSYPIYIMVSGGRMRWTDNRKWATVYKGKLARERLADVQKRWSWLADIHLELVEVNEAQDPRDFILQNQPHGYYVVGEDSSGGKYYMFNDGWFYMDKAGAQTYSALEAESIVSAKSVMPSWMRNMHMEPVAERNKLSWEESQDPRDFILKSKPQFYRITAHGGEGTRDGDRVHYFGMGDAYDQGKSVEGWYDAKDLRRVNLYTYEQADAFLRAFAKREAERTEGRCWVLDPHMEPVGDVDEAMDPRDFILKQPVGPDDAQECLVMASDMGFDVIFDETGEPMGNKRRKMPWPEASKLKELVIKRHGDLYGPVHVFTVDKAKWRVVRLESEEPRDFILKNQPEAYRITGTDDEGVQRWLITLHTKNDAWSSIQSQASLFTYEDAVDEVSYLAGRSWVKDVRIEPVVGQSAKEGYWRWNGESHVQTATTS